MADKAITDLTQAQQITDDDLFVLEQSGEAKKLKGSQVVQYAKDAVAEEVQGVKEYADTAKESADAAAASAEKAASAAEGIDDKVDAADASAKAAAASAAAAASSATGVDAKVQAAQTAAENAAKSETAAKNAQTAAANAQKAAESAQTGAQTAKTAAESAQEAAESAKDAAAGSATAAGQKATQAAQSAEDAASAKTAAETAKTDAQAARDAIVNMIVDAVTVETGKPATVSKSLADNVYKLVFGLPRGETGATGPQGATGNGISGIALKSGNHAPGTSDVYTITLTDGTTFDFAVYNGANGAGAGDMLASVYDPQGKRQDVFKYVDDAVKDVSITTDATPTKDSKNPVQSGGVYSALEGKLDKPTNDASATAGQVLTKTADGQTWADREKDMLVATLTGKGTDDDPLVSSPEPDEILTAAQTGKMVELHWDNNAYLLFSYYTDAEESFLRFNAVRGSSDTIILDILFASKSATTGAWEWDASSASTDKYLPNTGDGSNVTAAFSEASTRANIATGEKLSVLFGKIAKWFADLGSLAFKSTVSKSDLASDVQTSLGKADSALQSAPVTSVNSKTGAVTLGKSDVGLGNVDNVKQYSASNPPPYPVTSVNGATGAVTVDVPTVPSTTSPIKGDGSGGLAAAVAELDFASPVKLRKVTLTTAGWDSSTKQQTVTVSGVLADTTAQCIYPYAVDTSYNSAWNSCGVLCVAQAANSLTFQCSEVPTSAIEVYVTIVTVKYA